MIRTTSRKAWTAAANRRIVYGFQLFFITHRKDSMDQYLYMYCTSCLDSWTCREAAVAAPDSRCKICKCGGPAEILAKAEDEQAVRNLGSQRLADIKAAKQQ